MQQDIKIEKVEESKLSKVDFNNLVFGKTFSDHMFQCDYKDNKWQTPMVSPFQNINVSPALVALHYGISIFEGLKAFKHSNGHVYAFRPEKHVKRINSSAHRLCMPEIPEEIFMGGLKALLATDIDWIPSQEGCSLYIRPTYYGSDEYLGVAPSKNYKFFIISSPVGKYYSGAVKVKVESEFTRAAEGGTGYIKMGGNYAAALLPTKKAVEEGYTQVIWTDGKEHKYIEEAGTMNIMFQIDDTIITPNTSSSILPGITRESVLELAHHWGYKVEERKISIDEVIEAQQSGRLKDAFGTGTAATITHISTFNHKGVDYELPSVAERDFSVRAQKYLTDLKAGKAEDYMNWMVRMA